MLSVPKKVEALNCMGDRTSAINAKASSYMKAFSMLWKTGLYINTCGLAGYLRTRTSATAFLYLHPAFAQTGPNFRFGTHRLRICQANGCPSHLSQTVLNCSLIPTCPWDTAVATSSTTPSRKSGGGRGCKRMQPTVCPAVLPANGTASRPISLPSF